MAFKHKITKKWESAGAQITKAIEYIGSGEHNVEQAIDAGASDLEVSYAIDPDYLKSFYMVATTDMVVVPHNLADDPMDQIDLSAGVVFEWTHDSNIDNPFDEAISKLFVDNPGEAEGTLSIRSLVDATPTNAS